MDTIKANLMRLVGVGLSTVVVLLLIRFVGPLPLTISQTTTNKQSTFDVIGESESVTTPDEAIVVVGITASESSVKAAQNKINQVMNDINAELGKMGIDKKDVKTKGYSISPSYDYQVGQRIVGYSASVNLSIRLTDFDSVNLVIDKATSLGANQVGGVSFSLSADKEERVKNELRKEAIDKAKKKANDLAQLAGMRLGRIVNIVEGGQPVMTPFAREMMVTADGKDVPTKIEPGSTTISYSVTLSYETL